jgi:formylglycine-generating enzyme required for sulfatase activity
MLRRAVYDVNSGSVHVISTAVSKGSKWNNSPVPVRLSRSGHLSFAGADVRTQRRLH